MQAYDPDTQELGPLIEDEPSPVPGLTMSAYLEYVEQILRFRRLSLGEKLQQLERDVEWGRALARMADRGRGA